MSELLEFAFSGINLIPTIFMIFVIVYWSIVILGIVGADALDFDVDMDTDMDIDGGVEIGGVASVLSFFNIGHMPLMIFVTFFTIPLWMLTLITNDYLGISGWLLGSAIFVAAFVVSLFIAKILTTPIARFYRKLKQNTEAIDNVIGRICTAKLNITSDRKGQAEIKVNGTSVLIYAKTRPGLEVKKGESALIIEHNKPDNFYFVEPYFV